MPDLSQKALHNVAFGAPVPGQSWTMPPKTAKWEHPPQFTDLKKAMYYMMDQLTDSFYMKKLLTMMDANMPIEAIARTLLFGGFTQGKWTVDIALLMYKPLMLSLIAIAHRAGLKDVPVLMPKSVVSSKQAGLKMFMMADKIKNAKTKADEMRNAPMSPSSNEQAPQDDMLEQKPPQGFMSQPPQGNS